ncbi:MAG: hypothetical protein LBN74_00060 [Prevotella sp.]|jgi:iron uptake system EfeUOB component EfeO/EfeM|nr:hypothetical protein [Prevotella sp.]
MKQSAYLAYLFVLIIFYACSSVDGDAKKAAELNKESLEYAKKPDLHKAEELYKESREIINKYKETDKYEEFQKAYHQYMRNGWMIGKQ